jgi:putative acetyltransferase
MLSSLQVRLEKPNEHATIHTVVASAFGGELVADLLDALRVSSAWRDLSFVAVRAEVGREEIVGHVSYTRGWVDAPEKLFEVLILSPLSVRPDVQNQGVGSALVRESLAQLAGRTEGIVFLEGDPRYYSRFGFRPASAFGFQSPSVRIPDPAFQCLWLCASDPNRIGRLVYPDIFWQFDAVGLRESHAM